MKNARLDEAQAGIKTAGRNINNLRYVGDTTLRAESEEEPKSLLTKVKRSVEKLAQNSTFKKRRSWHLVPSLHGKQMGKQWKQWETLFWGLQNLCKWWLQPWNEKMLVPWKKTVTNLDSRLQSRDITLPPKVRLIKAMVFPVVIYGCENWTIKKAECQRIDAFEL